MDTEEIVFLSSTSEDLKAYRDAVYEGLSQMGIQCIRFEDFGSVDGEPLEVCLENLSKASALVGLIAHNYGSIKDRYNKSMTHLEYEKAKTEKMSRLMFLAHNKFLVPADLREPDQKAEKQKAFREEILNDRFVDFFYEPQELAEKVRLAVSNHFEKGIQVSLAQDKYVIIVTTSKATKTYIEEVLEGIWYFPIDDNDPLIKNITVIPQSTLKQFHYNFTDGEIPEGAIVDNPKFRTISTNEKAILLERATTNLLLNSTNPQNQHVSLSASRYADEYILWIQGEGSVEVKGIVNGVATSSKPFKFKIYEDGVILLNVIGEVKTYQLEQGSIPTSFIPTSNAITTRAPSHLSISLPE